jgi:CrcB protein
MTLLLVSVAGGVGAVLRYVVSGVFDAVGPGRGTLVVNVAGSFAAGLFVEMVVSVGLSRVVALGFLGGFTTFSTWIVDALTEVGERPMVHQLVLSMALGLGAGAAGMTIGVSLL